MHFLMIRRPPRSTQSRSSAASDVYKRQFQYGGGKELYDRLWKEMGRDIKGFMLQPVGPEALGWFPKKIKNMADFRKYKFRTPPGIPGQTYKDIGIASVAMGGGDILPALQAGTIDAAEWCCPCLLYTSPSPRDVEESRMPSSA